MSFIIGWDDEAQRILRIDVDGQLSWEQMYTTLSQVRTLVPDDEERLDVIVHIQPHTLPPPNQTAHDMLRALRELPENPGLRVFVGGGTFTRTMNELFNVLYGDTMGIQITYANNLDAARRQIAEDRAQW